MLKIKFSHILIFVNLVLVTGQLFLSFSRATQGSQLARLQTQSRDLAGQNSQLRQQVYSRSSLTYIHSQAK